jgi:putative DNA methylase
MTARKKLIEVALPLDAINAASAKEKSIRHGHPSTLHLWWARRPLAACRAVLFASLVDDPSSHPDRFPTEEAQEAERERLFEIIRELVKWENSGDQRLLARARQEIVDSCNGTPPPVLDPFCGGGSIPLEAQRLGLLAYASDLNPVAVLITKALIEIPPRFTGREPINPDWQRKSPAERAVITWHGAAGLAEDIRWYSQWMRTEAAKRIGHLYPKVRVTKDLAGDRHDLQPMIGQELTVIAWLWARTVKCPHPDCGGIMPLVKSFSLSTKKGRNAWVEYVVDHIEKSVHFSVRTGQGQPPASPKTGRGAKFRCLICGKPVDDQHIKDEGVAKRMRAQLMATVAEGKQGRLYLSPDAGHTQQAAMIEPRWIPVQELANDPRNLWCIPYGLKTFADLFTPRQLVALTTFSDLVREAREVAFQHFRSQRQIDIVSLGCGQETDPATYGVSANTSRTVSCQ